MLPDQGSTDASPAIGPREDDSLCASLYRHYAPGILAYLRRHLPTQEDAEDLLLEVFLAALEYEPRLATLSDDEHRAWLGTVARNKVIDHHRRAGRRRFLPLEKAESISIAMPDRPSSRSTRRVVRFAGRTISTMI